MRNTEVRQAIIEILESAQKPLVAKYLLALLERKGLSPNKTTVYRQLEKMEADGVIHKVFISDREASYEKMKDHHHHLVCGGCGKIEDVDLYDEKFIKKLLSQKGFATIDHRLEIFGFCLSCSRSK